VVVHSTGLSQAYLGSHSGRNFVGRHSATTDWFVINNPTSTDWTFAIETGFLHLQRTASNAAALFQNGVSVQTASIASAAINSQNLYTLATNGNPGPSPSRFADGQLALAFAGGSLSGKEAAFYNRTHTFLNAVNSGVFP
jgi:hypothetical protein